MSLRVSLPVFVAVSLSLMGCAGLARDPMMPAEARAMPDRPRAGSDNFWHAHAWAEEKRPEPERPRSISLGFLSEAPLQGGVTRDSPMPERAPRDPRAGMSWQDYVNAPTWSPQQHLPQGLSTPPPRRRAPCLCDPR